MMGKLLTGELFLSLLQILLYHPHLIMMGLSSELHKEDSVKNLFYVCVCANSRNDVPRVAQRNGTVAAHTWRRASVLVVFVVFCVHMHSFANIYFTYKDLYL